MRRGPRLKEDMELPFLCTRGTAKPAAQRPAVSRTHVTLYYFARCLLHTPNCSAASFRLTYLAKDHCRGQSKGQHPPFKLTDRIAVTWTHALSQAWGLPGYFPPSGEADETNQVYMYLQMQNGIFLQNIHTLLYPPKSANSSQSHLQGYLVAFFCTVSHILELIDPISQDCPISHPTHTPVTRPRTFLPCQVPLVSSLECLQVSLV